ncbi:hypothetical protein CRYUN_Cryun20dG0126500 [Craigia yunnanensis]
MHPNSFSISSPLAFFFFLFALIRIPNILCADDPRYSDCRKTIRCGSIANIGYPFWGINRRNYCGQTGFELKCEDDVAKITMSRNTLRILDVNPQQQILKVAREDYWNGYCPMELINTTINFNQFNYGSNLRNLTLFYGCHLPSILVLFFQGNCTIYGAIMDVLYATTSIPGDPRPGACDENVIVPIYETAAQNLEVNLLSMNDALRGGFELQWVVDNDQCRRCRDSDGVCGYNQTTNSFICFCRDQPSETTCSPTQGCRKVSSPQPTLSLGDQWFQPMQLILTLAPKSVFGNDGNISSCSERFHFRDIQNIGYPFWGLDRPESCGHPAFRLNCIEDFPEITLMSATYRVLNINNRSQILEVARIDYSENICPTNLINSTFNSNLFQYNRDTRDIRLYYDCQPFTGLENLTSITAGISSQFDCIINQTNIIGYYVTRNITETSFGGLVTFISNSLGSCNNSVIIPVLNSEVQSLEENQNSDILIEALSVGFELQWSAYDSLCDTCISSGGQCGHNLTSGEFICYCLEGPYPDDCPSSLPGASPFLSCLLKSLEVGCLAI